MKGRVQDHAAAVRVELGSEPMRADSGVHAQNHGQSCQDAEMGPQSRAELAHRRHGGLSYHSRLPGSARSPLAAPAQPSCSSRLSLSGFEPLPLTASLSAHICLLLLPSCCVPVLVCHSVLSKFLPLSQQTCRGVLLPRLAGASHHQRVLCLHGRPWSLAPSPSIYEPVCSWTGQRAGGHSLVTRLCDHLVIYHQGRQCFHKLPQPGAACAGINSRLSPNTQLLITTGEGWPDVARRGTLGPCLVGGGEG